MIFMKWLFRFGRLPYLLLVVGVSVFWGWQLRHLKIEQSNQSMTSGDLSLKNNYQHLLKVFGTDDLLLLTITSDQLLQKEGLKLIALLSDLILKFDGVKSVSSLTTLTKPKMTFLGIKNIPLLEEPFKEKKSDEKIKTLLQENPFLMNYLISKDYKTTAIGIELEDREGDDLYRKEIIGKLRGLVKAIENEELHLHLSGVSVQKNDVAEYIQKDQKIFIPLSCAIFVSLLFFLFRNGWGVFFPMLITALSCLWTLGFYSWLGYSLNTITSLLAPLVMTLALATSIHFYHGFLHNDAPHFSNSFGRVQRVLKQLFLPSFFTTLTTVIGFSSLSWSQIPAIKQFGFFASFGVTIAFFLGMTFLPVCLSYIKISPTSTQQQKNKFLTHFLEYLTRISYKHPFFILTLTLILSALSFTGIKQLKNNTDLVGFFKKSAPLYQSTSFIDQHLTGVYSFEFLISKQERADFDSKRDFVQIKKFNDGISKLQHVTNVFSVIDPFENIYAFLFKKELFSETSASQAKFNRVLKLLSRISNHPMVAKWIASDFKETRVSVRFEAVGTFEAEKLLNSIQDLFLANFDANFKMIPTGNFYGITKESNLLVKDQLRSFILALFFILISIGLFLRSFKLMIVAAVANILPILCALGVMGWLKIDLSSGTAMIAAVVIGLAVDGSIHYLARFVKENTEDLEGTIRRTTHSTGRALLYTSLILAGGFWVGCFGSFKPTIYFSFLTGATILGAFLSHLTVLPACLHLGQMIFGRERFWGASYSSGVKEAPIVR